MRRATLIFCFLLLLPGILSAQEIPVHLYSKPNTPIVKVGGFINFNAAYVSQADSFARTRLPDATVTNGVVETGSPGTYNNNSRDIVFSNDSEVYIKVGAISNTGIKYGAVIELEADVTNDGLNEGINSDKTYIFTEAEVGKFEFGNNSGVNQNMKVGPSNFARAAGGITGEYLQYVNLPMLSHSSQSLNPACDSTNGDECGFVKVPRFIVIPQAPVAHGGYAKGYISASDPEFADITNANLDDTNSSFARNSLRNGFYDFNDGSFGQMEDATKISFYTPRVDNWQFGVSYTPDTGDIGTTSALSGNDTGDIEDVISVGLNYSNNFGNLGLAFSVTGESGQYENVDYKKFDTTEDQRFTRNDLLAYDVGFMLTYFGFTIGGSYGNWGDSLQMENSLYSCDYDSDDVLGNQDCNSSRNAPSYGDAYYYSAGLAYEFGPVALSLTHIQSEFQSNEYQATSLGIDYKLAKGLLPYIEVTQYEFASNQPQASDIVNQSSISNDRRQLRDNDGYVGLLGILFSF